MEKTFVPADILLPSVQYDPSQWACVACDQFTSEPEYWQKAWACAAGQPSTLRLILPEVYLNSDSPQRLQERIESIHEHMKVYRIEILRRKMHGFMYIERTQMDGSVRQGLVGCVDLEDYSYEKGAKPLIRPSENTVVERIPPRLAVRRGAVLELPHVMMLLDDPEKAVIEPLADACSDDALAYDFDLMLQGGHLCGWRITDEAVQQRVMAALERLASREVFDARYPAAAGQPPLMMAVGDGNHSLATAKAHWDEIKTHLTEEERRDHPARLCLVELCNVHSPAIQMEPIHRLFTGTTGREVLAALTAWSRENGLGLQHAAAQQTITLVDETGAEQTLGFASPAEPLAVGTAEAFVGHFLASHPGAAVDYIHGADTVRALARKGGVGLLMPDFAKSDLFKGVVLGGVLPRKTFSMGHAQEKRYYMECRDIDPDFARHAESLSTCL